MSKTRATSAVEAVLPRSTPVSVIEVAGADSLISIASTPVRVRWVTAAWPAEVARALRVDPRPDVVASPVVSPGARQLLASAGVGWLEEGGDADFNVGTIVVSRVGIVRRTTRNLTWTRAVLLVAECLLTGSRATVSEISSVSGLSAGTATRALGLLTKEGFLAAERRRGPTSGRKVIDAAGLLASYADHVPRQRPAGELTVGVLWRDPVAEAADLARRWHRLGYPSAATGPLAAAVLAPLLTNIAPLQMYVAVSSHAELRIAARDAGLDPMPGGRLTLRPFPAPGTARLVTTSEQGLPCAPWPLVYADLRTTGVRGEDAAAHLLELVEGVGRDD